mgnify:CR=1 FL=1|tara:strand:+ start:394 stop:660 length:267 start_codon:yes stop_codon:yes gene_type:complete
MATKKSTKPVENKKETLVIEPSEPEVKPVEVPKDVLRKSPYNPPLPVEQYLMSIGTRPNLISPMAAWAKGKGLSVATVGQWQTLFESF